MIRRRNEDGYILISLAVALVIIGTLFAGAIPLWEIMQKKERFEREKQVVAESHAALDRFFQTSGRYPCPAPRDVSGEMAAAGLEDCSAALPSGITAAVGTDSLEVLIGVLPYKTLGLSRRDVKNPYNGSAVTYAVTRTQTDAASYDGQGGIGVEQETIDAAGGIVTQVIDEADFILVSHGVENAGSYFVASGLAADTCMGDAVSEGENCDNDALFRAHLRRVGFDDIVAYSTEPLVMRPPMKGDGVWYTAAAQRSGGAARVGGSYTEVDRASHIFTNVIPGVSNRVNIPLSPMDVFLRIEADCGVISTYGNLPSGGRIMNRTLLNFYDAGGVRIPWNVEQVCARLAGGVLGPRMQQVESQIRLLMPIPPAARSARIEAQLINDSHSGFRFFSAVIRATKVSSGP